MSTQRSPLRKSHRPLTLPVVWRCLRAPYRRARQLNPDDYWTLWNSGKYWRAMRSEFDYVLRLYFAPLLAVHRFTGRVIGCVVSRVRMWITFCRDGK